MIAIFLHVKIVMLHVDKTILRVVFISHVDIFDRKRLYVTLLVGQYFKKFITSLARMLQEKLGRNARVCRDLQ